MKKNPLLILAVFICFIYGAYELAAQQIDITGKIVDPESHPVSDVKVTLMNKSLTVYSDNQGNFHLSAATGIDMNSEDTDKLFYDGEALYFTCYNQRIISSIYNIAGQLMSQIITPINYSGTYKFFPSAYLPQADGNIYIITVFTGEQLYSMKIFNSNPNQYRKGIIEADVNEASKKYMLQSSGKAETKSAVEANEVDKLILEHNSFKTKEISVPSYTHSFGDITISEKSDLIIQSITMNPPNPQVNQNITFTVVVKNIGEGSANASQLEIKVGGETLGEKYNIPGLAKNATHTSTRSISLGVAQNYRTTAIIDTDNAENETNENNNEKYIDFSVAAADKPDLIVESITMNPPNPQVNQNITFTVVVKNIGEGYANACKLEIKVGGETLGIKYNVPGLAKNATHTSTRSISLGVAQNYRTTAIIDTDNAVNETNENNNEKYIDFSVAAADKPDLIVESITMNPPNPQVNQNITFTVVVKNIGEGYANACKLEIKVGGETLGIKYNVPGLAKNATHTSTRSISLGVAQNYRTTAIIDTDNAVNETNENNNEKYIDFSVAAADKPDLIVESITMNPTNPHVNQNITFTVVVKNIGEGYANACKLEIKVGGETLGIKYNVPGLAKNATHTSTRSISLGVAQNYRTTAIIDTDNVVDETNENNNEKFIDFSVTEKPDLIVESITMNPTNPHVNQSISFTVVVKNIGEGYANACKLAIKVGGESLGEEYNVPGLAKNATHTSTRYIILGVAQNYRTTAIIDNDDAVDETNENNNEKYIQFTVSN